MKRGLSFLLILALALTLFAGCAPKSESTEAAADATEQAADTPQELKDVTVILDWTPNTNHTGLYVAKDLGYYEEAGLNVEIIQPSEADAASLIAAGKGEFGVSYQEQVTFARTADTPLPIKAIAAVIQHNTSGFASKADDQIVTPKDFEGKQYGGWGSPMEEATLKAMMTNDDADFSKLEMVDIGALDFFAAVDTDIDFTWIFYGWDGVAAELRDLPINFIKLQDFDPALDYYTPVLIASEELLNTDPELAKAFLAATQKGYEYCVSNPDEAVESLLKDAPEIDRDLAIASQQYLADEYIADAASWGLMKDEVWEAYGTWLLDRQLIPKALETSEAYTNDYLPQ